MSRRNKGLLSFCQISLLATLLFIQNVGSESPLQGPHPSLAICVDKNSLQEKVMTNNWWSKEDLEKDKENVFKEFEEISMKEDSPGIKRIEDQLVINIELPAYEFSRKIPHQAAYFWPKPRLGPRSGRKRVFQPIYYISPSSSFSYFCQFPFEIAMNSCCFYFPH